MIIPIIHIPLPLTCPTADPCSRRITTQISQPSQDTWSRHLLIPQGTQPPPNHPALSDQLQLPHHTPMYPLQLITLLQIHALSDQLPPPHHTHMYPSHCIKICIKRNQKQWKCCSLLCQTDNPSIFSNSISKKWTNKKYSTQVASQWHKHHKDNQLQRLELRCRIS